MKKKIRKNPVPDKTYLNPSEFKKLKGAIEAKLYTYWPEKKLYRKTIKLIRGVAAAKRNAKTYILATNVGINEMYLMSNGKLSNEKKDAVKFYQGFDNPINRKEHWERQTGLKYHTCHY